MTFQTNVTTALLTVTAQTVLAEDPEHVYSTVSVSPVEPESFERNAVVIEFGVGSAIEVIEVDGQATLRMLHADARTVAAALTAFYAEAASVESETGPVETIGSTALGEGLNHSDQTPHRA